MSTVYSAEEVVQHNHERDLWIVYNNGVYDVTKFLKEHPGGEEVLLSTAGKDATKCFDEIGHTTEAVVLRETYKIGTVDGPVPVGSSMTIDTSTANNDNLEKKTENIQLSRYVPMLIVGGVAIFLYYTSWFATT
ncbi:cytochrome b5 [Ptiloglossa arizonensis]|uniref:cytochrome b5 n=1 Tax=Ptiloglossa arizonensis TaxID=3350558 RepID=UPI003FA0E664